MKHCINCNEEKPLSEYYKHKEMADGHLNKCKECVKDYANKRRLEKSSNPEWVKSERDRHREKYHRLNYKEKHKPSPEDQALSMARYKDRYPEKVKAKILCQHIPTPKGFQKHHWSYKKKDARDVIILKVKEHYKAHRFLNYDQSKKLYRTLKGNLLTSKKMHLWYLKKCGVRVLKKSNVAGVRT